MITAKLYNRFAEKQVNKIIKHIEKTQALSYERIRSYQLSKLKKLLSHSYDNIPYYRRIFKSIGALPEDINTFDEFKLLPILTKDIIKKNFNDLIDRNLPKDDLISNSTGGSTGEPLHFYQDKNFKLWANAARIRGWYNIAGCDAGESCGVLWGAMHEVSTDFSFWERFRDIFQYGDIYLNAFNLSEERKLKFIRLWRIFRPKLIRGYFTAIKDMAIFIDHEKIKFPKIKGVILGAETVDSESQRYIEKIFKAPSYNTYGGRELSLIAMECNFKCGLHEVSENNYIEFEPITLSGYKNAGNLIITNLNNFAMPFMRYRIGDIGIPGDNDRCQCGRGLPRIKKVIGRTTEVFEFYDGTRIAGEMFIHLMKDFPLNEYQFLQNSLKSVILLHKGTDLIDSLVKEKIVHTYQGYLPAGVDFTFQKVTAFEKTVTGKFKFIKKDISD